MDEVRLSHRKKIVKEGIERDEGKERDEVDLFNVFAGDVFSGRRHCFCESF